jgi:glutamine amidotransferase
LGAQVKLAQCPDDIRNSTHIVLPGVGAMASAMSELKQIKMIEEIRNWMESRKPLLGICLGMQLLADFGEEGLGAEGLGIIPGNVNKIRGSESKSQDKNPRIGWFPVRWDQSQHSKTNNQLFAGIPQGTFYYFAHSFELIPKCDNHAIAHSGESTHQIVAAVRSGGTVGVQFHPEKSGRLGLRFLRNFLDDTSNV